MPDSMLHYDLDWLHQNHTVIDDDTDIEQHINELDNRGLGRGYIKRGPDYSPGCRAFAPSYPDSLIINPSDYASRFADQQQAKTSLWDVREANYETLKSYDQNGYGLCWAFSSTKAATYLRVLLGVPGARLAPYYVAGEIKGWRDQGGNGDESLAFITSNGVPQESFCPNYSSKNATPAAAANAALNKIAVWHDGSDRCKEAMISAGLLTLPGVGDFDFLSHSMAFCYIASINPLVTVWDNSWGAIDQYGAKGTYIIKGSHAVPDNFFVAVSIEASQL